MEYIFSDGNQLDDNYAKILIIVPTDNGGIFEIKLIAITVNERG